MPKLKEFDGHFMCHDIEMAVDQLRSSPDSSFVVERVDDAVFGAPTIIWYGRRSVALVRPPVAHQERGKDDGHPVKSRTFTARNHSDE